MTKKVQHLLDAALDLAAEKGWQAVTLADVAVRARQPLSEVYAHFHSRADILRAFLDRVDQHMMSGEVDEEASPRDRLFEAAMRRFEVLNRHKGAVRALLSRGAGVGPVTALCGARRFGRSMALMLEAAGISAAGLAGLVRINGATAVYLYAMRAWLHDETPDMAKTMAALDKALTRAEAVAATCGRGSGPVPSAGEAQPG